MLVDQPMTLTIPVGDLQRARDWYRDRLGLSPVDEVPGEALVCRTPSDQSLSLLLCWAEAGAVAHQVAAWRVEDLDGEMAELRERGVRFEEYDQPDLRTVDGVPSPRSGARRGSRTARATC